MIDALRLDLRYALRQLRASRAFTAVAVLTLALGIGANTAVFSIVEGVMLARLPYFQANRLVMVWESNPRFPRVWNSYPNFQDWQRSSRSFQQMAAFREQAVDLTFPGAPSNVKASQISAGFFNTLGIQLPLGREFSPQEDEPGGPPEAVISDRLWRERFGGSAEVLGKNIVVDGVSYAIAGVAPAGFRLEADAEVYVPLGQVDRLILNNRGSHDGVFTVARLRPGVSIAQSQAEMNTIQSGLDHLYPEDNRDLGIYVEPLKQAIVGDAGPTLALLSGAVGLVLLIACANVANLLLARSAGRSREFAIRSALGASRARLVRQLLTESVILALAGAILGAVIAFVGIRSALPALAGVLRRSEGISVNGPVLFYTLMVSLLVGIVFGLVPALKNGRDDLQASLKEGGRGATVMHGRAQSSFVVAQVALTLMLLVGAGLLLRTILHLWSVNPGFETQNIVAFKVGVSHSRTKTPSETRAAYGELVETIRHIPGVLDADLTTAVPLTGHGGYLPFWLDSRKPESLQGAPRMGWFLTGPGYLRTMGMQLLQGRFLSERDDTQSPCVAVIDSNFARVFFPEGQAIGHSITAGFAVFGPCAIVGIVNHVKYADLLDSGAANQYQAYYSLAQVPDQWVPVNYPDASVVVRTPLDTASLIPAITDAVHQVSSDQPVYDVQTMRQIMGSSMSEQRFPMILLAAFAGLALLLASVGVYGMISYSVTQRVQEIGIRMALGAGKREVLRLFIGQEFRLVLIGIVFGSIGALMLSRVLASFSHLLYGVAPDDPLTFATVSVVLIALATISGYLPARRAANVDPMVVLRNE